MTAMVPEPAPTLKKLQIPQKDIDDFIRKNGAMLSTEAKDLFKNMGAEDQRRVLNSGPLNIYRDTMAMFKFRVAISRDREQEIADRKGGDFVAKEASEQEVKDWCNANKEYLGEEGVKQLDMFGTADQWRIISEGPAAENMDSVHIIQSRAKRSREMANTVATMFAQRREMANKRAEETVAAKAQAKPLFAPKMADTVQAFFNRVVGCEVPESQRRCGGFGVQHALEEDRSKLVGKVKGVDGVVEILKTKYQCMKGERYRVIGDLGGPAGMWKLDGGKTVPKTHLKEGGWKWVLEEPEPEVKAAKPVPVQTKPVETFTPKELKKQQDAKPASKEDSASESEESGESEERKKPVRKKKALAAEKKRTAVKKDTSESEEDEEDSQPKKRKKRVVSKKRQPSGSSDDEEDSGEEDSRETARSRKKVKGRDTGRVLKVRKRKVRSKRAQEPPSPPPPPSNRAAQSGRAGAPRPGPGGGSAKGGPPMDQTLGVPRARGPSGDPMRSSPGDPMRSQKQRHHGGQKVETPARPMSDIQTRMRRAQALAFKYGPGVNCREALILEAEEEARRKQ